MRKLIFYAVGIFFLSVACNSGSSNQNDNATGMNRQEMDHEEDGHDHAQTGRSQNMKRDSDAKAVTVKRSGKASAILDAYLDIKNALAEDDHSAAADAGSQLEKQAVAMDVNDIDDQSQMQEIKEILDVVKEHGEHIAESEMPHQREHFAMLDKDIVDLVKIVGSDRDLYEQYCPMYDNNKGGAWLSTSDQIENPLLGSKMPKCGEVQQVITMQ